MLESVIEDDFELEFVDIEVECEIVIEISIEEFVVEVLVVEV